MSVIITTTNPALRWRAALGLIGLALIQGCATQAPTSASEDHLSTPGWEASVGGHDRAMGGRDGVLSQGDRSTLGGRDKALGGADTAYSDGDRVMNSDHDRVFAQNDRVLNTTNSVVRPEMAPTPKRPLTKEEMAALTVAVSKMSGDPNSLTVVDAQADDTRDVVRNLCARLHDSRLDDENNRYNVIFGIVESAGAGRSGVSVIDTGQRASVVCKALGYLS